MAQPVDYRSVAICCSKLVHVGELIAEVKLTEEVFLHPQLAKRFCSSMSRNCWARPVWMRSSASNVDITRSLARASSR